MDTDLKVTDQPEEIAFDDVVAGDNIINIPLFQRAYKWTEKNITQFWDDVESIIDGSSKSHFLGVLVLVPQSRRIGQPVLLDIVDGQQRLSTCYLCIMAMVQAAAEDGDAEWAVEVARGHLLTRRFANYSTNTKLIPSAADRQQFQLLWSKITNLRNLEQADWGNDAPSPPQPSGARDGRMTKAYGGLIKRTKSVIRSEGMDGLNRYFEIIVGRLSFVTINLRSPTAAPAIFERLNARGEKINISDLVRNEVFARVADDPMRAQSIFDSHWEPFIGKFRDKNLELEPFLFPYGLTTNPQITKADLFQILRTNWASGQQANDPRAIIESLDVHTGTFFALETGSLRDIPTGELRMAVNRLHALGAPTSIYPFMFLLCEAVRTGELADSVGAEISSLIESFLIRRAVCGIEPTGLHAVFKGLWDETKQSGPTVKSVQDSISRRTTVPWPSDVQFKEAIVNEPIYGRKIAKYAISEFEKVTHGETPIDDFQIEHIFPQKPHADWDIEENEEAERLRHTWGNLIPLSSTMNPSVGPASFDIKRNAYKDAVFASPREIASNYEYWDLETIKTRSTRIAEWAINHWKYGRS